MEPFEMERMQSTWESVVDYDMSESGVVPVTLRELVEMGLGARKPFLDEGLRRIGAELRAVAAETTTAGRR